MLRSGSIVVREGRVRAAAGHVPVTPESFDVPFPRAWPSALVVAGGRRSPKVVVVRDVPWWGLVSSAVAPVLLVGGWTLAAGLQPGSFDAVTATISSLAAVGAADRWVMTLALAGVGACYVITGVALRPAALAGRLMLMSGGAATMLVAVFPETAGHGGSLPHTFWATVGFVGLAAWPLAARGRGPLVPGWLRLGACAGAAGVLLGLLVWFGAELIGGGRQVGLAERVLAGAEAVWPLAVVLACQRKWGRHQGWPTGRVA